MKIDKMYKWQTEVDIAPISTDRVGTYKDQIVTLGSCFSEEIGQRLFNLGYSIEVNPYGTLYNPLSVAQSIDFLLSDELPHSIDDNFFLNGLWHSSMHHGRFSNSDREVMHQCIADSWSCGHDMLMSADWLFLTLGTAYYYLDDSERIIANAHKRPEYQLKRQRCSIEQGVAAFERSFSHLIERNPNIKILWSVSPVRYMREGATNNNVSKAILRLMIDELVAKYDDRSFYFPSYELLNDELRDYRFYASDMVHPSDDAINYIFSRFLSFWADSQEASARKEANALYQLIQHRPLNEASKEKLQEKIVHKSSKITEKYPNLAISNITK